MSGFSLEWLALREPADRRARAARLEADLVRHFANRSQMTIVDLGAGSGSNLRHLAPRLSQTQNWLLVDHDPDLLQQAQSSAKDLTAVTAKARQYDLANGLEGLGLHNADLVTASALMDLVSREWFDRLSDASAGGRAVLLFTVNVDGRLSLSPEDEDDREISAAFDRHQSRDKGFGPALGPQSVTYMRARLSKLGYRVAVEPSDWCLGSGDRALLEQLLRGHAMAAREARHDLPGKAEHWLSRRLDQLSRGEIKVIVGHKDLLAVPPG